MLDRFIEWVISKIGYCRTCADCKHLNQCWNRIDEYALDNPACENFEEGNKND